MNFYSKLAPHTKIAIIIAPFLLIGGYIATDYYLDIITEQKNLFQLKVQGKCHILTNDCVLIHDRLQLKLSDQQGITKIISNHPLDDAALSIVTTAAEELQYKLKSENQKLWQVKTQLAQLSSLTNRQKLRVIVMLNKGYYYSEFYTDGLE